MKYAIQNLGDGEYIDKQQGILISIHLFFQNKGSRPKMGNTALDCSKRDVNF
jgi:hypothetical protein